MSYATLDHRLIERSIQSCTVVADYFACQKFRGLATKRDTQIFRGGKFSLIRVYFRKKNSARNNLLLTRAIVLMELWLPRLQRSNCRGRATV